ncbi:M42 family metallopeptidase [Kosmotoga pacifica]|uniref:Endoglucanase n=1 Tax=Kosmotoga pacifica TaxID=1330330 RepID=A0A0G2Z6C1_9BACT|nr:M42 family metallopeptidase [Kosmotoga pacifica]AKI97097.1 endoglucanase [Kosmotoga pacifica]
MDFDKLTELLFVPGISGREEMIREKIIELLPKGIPYHVDDLGNLIVEIGQGEKLLGFAAHMDELGLLITGVNPDGTLNFKKIGGIPEELLPGRHVDVINSLGESIDGIIGFMPPHLSKNSKGIEPVIDVGASSPEEVSELGIEVIDYAVFRKQVSILNDKFVAARALDDRFGCALLLEFLEKALDMDLNKKLLFVWTVQEEVGLVGAQAIAAQYRPTAFFPIDSFACCSKLTGNIKPGNGPVLRMNDSSSIASYDLGKRLLSLAKEKEIPLQFGVTGGGTDGIPFLRKGVKMVPLSLAIKNLHSEVEYLSVEDYDHLLNLLVEITKVF